MLTKYCSFAPIAAINTGICRRPEISGIDQGRCPGAPREIGGDQIAATIRKSLETRPQDAAHWSLGTMAKAVGQSAIYDLSALAGDRPAAAS
jgi:hypothetical protein